MWLGQTLKVNGKNYVVKELQDEPKNRKISKNGAILQCKNNKKEAIKIAYKILDENDSPFNISI
jgi:hypothetical protein